jgi:hypothetical protein
MSTSATDVEIGKNNSSINPPIPHLKDAEKGTSRENQPPAPRSSSSTAQVEGEGGSKQKEKGKGQDEFLVTELDEVDDPKAMSTARKWIALLAIGSASLCATCASSIVRYIFSTLNKKYI